MLTMSILEPFRFWEKNPLLVNEISENFDSIVIVSPDFSKQEFPPFLSYIWEILKAYKEEDKSFEDHVSFIVLDKHNKIRKLVYSPTGPLNRDYDDVRRFADATHSGIERILKAGGKNPLLIVIDSQPRFRCTDLAALLGAAQAVYVPLEVRESLPDKHSKVGVLGFYSPDASPEIMRIVSSIELGRVLCRDIGGSDPERMAAPNVALYVQEIFANTCVDVEVIQDESILQKEYPLLAAVNRAARNIQRHCARLIYLSYVPEGGDYDTTLVLVGKGITYDTGGADIKAGGVMAGMHRDKCGAAAVAGFFQTIVALKPKKVKVLGALCMVRNSVGSDCYVSDEIITSRAGVRVRVGNTDAEGRMVMADPLYHLKEKVVNEKNPYLFTVATLTGHAVLTSGEGYSIILDNGPALAEKVGESIRIAGDEVGDMFENSTIKREDYKFHQGPSEYEDVIQSNNLPSSKTERGHNTPAAFLIMSSGLDKHGIDSKKPLKYCHIDIAGSSGPFPGVPTGAPIPALTKRFLLN